MQAKRSLLATHWPGLLLFICSVVVALLVFRDYGVSWDEPIQRDIGQTNYDYVFHHDKGLLTYGDRSYGVALELPLILIEKGLHLTDTRDIIFMRHIVSHLFFLIGVLCGYILAYRLFRDRFLACMAFVLLAFNPRIYAHSYFNTKDIPFFAALLIAFLVCQVAFEKKRAVWYFALGLAVAFVTGIRAMGIMLVPLIGAFFVIDMITAARKKERTGGIAAHLLLFLVTFAATLLAIWPLLWAGPAHYFKEVFVSLSHAVWSGTLLFNGVNYRGSELPWYYVPEWMGITIPELWLLLGCAGLLVFIVWFCTRPLAYLTNPQNRNYVLYFLVLAAPVASVIALHTVNYDDWRHLYFIYPSFVMFVLLALSKLATGTRRRAVMVLCALQVFATGCFMISAHPNQQVYFNSLVSHKDEYLRTHFDLDYYGSSERKGIEYILAHDTGKVKLWYQLPPVFNNCWVIPAEQRQRLELTDTFAHDGYLLTTFRNHPDDYNYPHYYDIKVLNSTIMRVYKYQ